eukprot:ANDGO_00748.mRNA.1 GPN-loop GTPase 1
MSSSSGKKHQPVVCLVIGMAGSGKSTLMQRLCAHTFSMSKRDPSSHGQPYIVNLDPAVHGGLRFPAHIDIRQSIDYKSVMKQYELGPNGAIMTCLNLFGTKMHELMQLLETKVDKDPLLEYVWVDTPGQIEVFTWSASGSLITQCFATALPTVLLYVVDAERSRSSPNTFMSNMLYACSIMYKTQLPMLVVFNKSDLVSDPEILHSWMTDPSELQSALQVSRESQSSYYSDLSYSLSLVLDSFYENIRSCAVSAVTGAGVDTLLENIELCKQEFNANYKESLKLQSAEHMKRLEADLAKSTIDDAGGAGSYGGPLLAQSIPLKAKNNAFYADNDDDDDNDDDGLAGGDADMNNEPEEELDDDLPDDPRLRRAGI